MGACLNCEWTWVIEDNFNIEGRRVFLIENTYYDFNTTNSVHCGDYLVYFNTYGRNSGLELSPVTKTGAVSGKPPSVEVSPYFYYASYRLFGTAKTAGNSGYFRSNIEVCNQSHAYKSGLDMQCACIGKRSGITLINHYVEAMRGEKLWQRFSSNYWKSPHFPVNIDFWFCVISEAPKVQDNIKIKAEKNFSVAFEVPLVNALRRIPERVTVTGLPPGLSLSFNSTPPAQLGPDGVYVPESYQPVISGTPTEEGVFIAYVTASNPVGSTTTPITIQVGPFPNRAVSVGLIGASAFHVGDKDVSAIHVGDTQIYPYS